MGKKHKNKVRVLPGRMYRLVRSDRSVYCDAENALRTCFIEETKEQQAAREEGELCRFVRMAPDGGVELISNASCENAAFRKRCAEGYGGLEKWESKLN